jgi:hypothetical protein
MKEGFTTKDTKENGFSRFARNKSFFVSFAPFVVQSFLS